MSSGNAAGFRTTSALRGTSPILRPLWQINWKTPRRDVWWTKRLVFGIWGVAALALSVGTGLGLSQSFVAPAILLLVLPQFGPILTLIRKGTVEELYAPLHQVDTTESTATSLVSKAA